RRFCLSPMRTHHEGTFIGKIGLKRTVNHGISCVPQKILAVSDLSDNGLTSVFEQRGAPNAAPRLASRTSPRAVESSMAENDRGWLASPVRITAWPLNLRTIFGSRSGTS